MQTPASVPAPTSKSKSVVMGIVIGVVLGGMFSTCFGGVLGYSFLKKKEADVRRGWNLVPVVVAAVDIPEFSTVTFDMISQRSVPEQFVTSSVVKPDSASYVVNQKIQVPVQAGDPLLWTQFEAAKTVPMLFARRDIPLGVALDEADLEVKGARSELVTSSYVKEADRPQVIGRSLIAPFRAGDPILWTHFNAAPPPVKGR